MNKFIPDGNGLNRFKSGIFVDNFTDLKPQDTSAGVRNSIDKKEGILRPSHYSTAINMQVGSNAIARNRWWSCYWFTILQLYQELMLKEQVQLITLDYEDVLYQIHNLLLPE